MNTVTITQYTCDAGLAALAITLRGKATWSAGGISHQVSFMIVVEGKTAFIVETLCKTDMVEQDAVRSAKDIHDQRQMLITGLQATKIEPQLVPA